MKLLLILTTGYCLLATVSFAATNTFTDINLGPEGTLIGDANDLFRAIGSFNNETTNTAYNILASTFEFTSTGAHNLEQFSRDLGPCAGNLSNNFAFGTLKTAGVVTLMDNFANSPGNDAVYIQTITGTGTLNVGPGMRLYFGTTNGWAGTVNLTGGVFRPYLPDNVDSDGDGLSNIQECTCGTDPTNSLSSLRITSIAKISTNIFITWQTGLGKNNALERTAGVAGSFATNAFAAIFTVTNTVGTTTNYLDIGAATNEPVFYYRVRLVP